MKKDVEVQKSIRETTALIEEAMDVFQSSFRVYSDSVTNDVKTCIEKGRRAGWNSDVQNELVAIVKSMSESMNGIRQYPIKMRRALKVVLHKNEVHANDRLALVLERMKREAKKFERTMKELARSKSAEERNGK